MIWSAQPIGIIHLYLNNKSPGYWNNYIPVASK